MIYFVPSEGFRPCAPRVSVLREGVQVKVTSWVVTSLLVALIGLSSPSHVWAKPKFKVLASIPGGLWSGLTFDKQGNLYGLTTGGGAYRDGSIFKMTRGLNGKWAVTTLHSFNFNPDGEAPNGDLIFDAKGNLYGTTPDGGAYDGGTVFELAPGPSGWTFTVLYAFCEDGCSEGSRPVAGLAEDKDGNLLGTAGGGQYDMGVVFELAPGAGGWSYSILYDFGSRPDDGSDPLDTPTLDAKGNIYGTTQRGGMYGAGTVFRLSNKGSADRLLYSFCLGGFPCPGGNWPDAPVIFQSKGSLFGTTITGGDACYGGCGTVFSLTHDANGRWTHKVLYGFSVPADGFEPITKLVIDEAGNLYGTTATGGIGSCFEGCGVVYELSPAAGGRWKYTVLYKFTSPNQSPPDGRLILDSKGNLYGTALSIIYEITP